MKQSPEVECLVIEVHSKLAALPVRNTAEVRSTRREFSRRIVSKAPETVIQLALRLLDEDSELLRFFSYEMVRNHKVAWASLTSDDVPKLGTRLNSWSSVDCFAMYISGPMWAEERLSDETIAAWARSTDLWWRRAALVSTVALSRRGRSNDLSKVVRICTLLKSDREDMVVKALSWALREIVKRHPQVVRSFLQEHQAALAARVTREVNHKLRTGLKTSRSKLKTT